MSTKHTFECRGCGYKFNKFSQLMKHSREAHNVKSFYGDFKSQEDYQRGLSNATSLNFVNTNKKNIKALNNLVNGPFYKS